MHEREHMPSRHDRPRGRTGYRPELHIYQRKKEQAGCDRRDDRKPEPPLSTHPSGLNDKQESRRTRRMPSTSIDPLSDADLELVLLHELETKLYAWVITCTGVMREVSIDAIEKEHSSGSQKRPGKEHI